MMKITLTLACIAVVLAVMHVQPTSAYGKSQGPEIDKELEDFKGEIAAQQLNSKTVSSQLSALKVSIAWGFLGFL